MAKQVANVGSVLSKTNAVLNQHLKSKAKDPAVDSGFIDPPPGINGGIAQLVEFKFVRSQAKEGAKYPNKPMLQAVAIIKAPHEHEGIPVVGLRIRTNEMLCDTVVGSGKNKGQVISEAQHYENVMNLMKLVSGNDEFCANVQTAADLEPLAAMLEQAKPHFRFDTWGGGTYKAIDPATKKEVEKKSSVNSRWHGYVEFNAAPATAGTQDDSEQAEDAGAFVEAENAEDQAAAEESTEQAAELPDDLAELAAIANDPENEQAEGAGEKLLALAMEAGIAEDDARGAANWDTLVGMIVEAQSPAEEAAAPEPKVGEAWDYHTTTNGKKSAKPLKGKVVKFDKKSGKVTIKNLLTKKDVVIDVTDLVVK